MNDSFDKSPKKLSAGPKTRVCYVCGRQYGLHSFEIHLKQCKELWIAREAEKDPRERKKLPEDPMLKLGYGGGESGGGGGGDAGFSNGGGGSPMPSAKDLEEINKLSTAAFNTEALDTCAYCGRTFLPEKLVIHNRSCTAENPARRLADGVKRGGGAAGGAYTPSPTPTKSEVSTPVRPTSTARPRVTPVRNSAEYQDHQQQQQQQDGVTNLRIDDGNLVGHLGGSSGRPLRNSKSPGIASPYPDNSNAHSRSASDALPGNASGVGSGMDVFNVSDFKDKDEVVEYLLNKLDGLENIATDLARSIIEIRSVVDQLR